MRHSIRSRRGRRFIAGVLAATAALVVSACGTDDAGGPATSSPASPDTTGDAGGEVPDTTAASPGTGPADQAAEELAALEEAALAEGTMTLYTVIPEETAQGILADFRAAYPDIDTILVQSTPGGLTETFLADFSRGRVQADVLSLSSYPQVADVRVTGATEPFVPIGAERLRADLRGAEPDGIGPYFSAYTWAWRTDVPDELRERFVAGDWTMFEDPDVIEALRGRVVSLDPALTGTGLSGNLGLKQAMGDDQYAQFLAAFGQLSPVLYESNVPALEALSSGEALAILGHHGIIVGAIADGAPIETSFFDPTPGYASYMMFPTDAPHPAAGQLFLTWVLSDAGQESLILNYGVQSAVDGVPDNRAHTQMEWFTPESHDPDRIVVLSPEFIDAVDTEELLTQFADAVR